MSARLALLLVATALFFALGCKDEPAPAPNKGPQKMTPEMEKIVRDEVARQLAEERKRLTPPPRERPRPVVPPAPPVVHPVVDDPPPTPSEEAPVETPPEEVAPEETAEETASPTAADNSLTVTDLQTATAVDREARAPVGISSSFALDAGEVWAYVVLKNDSTVEREVAFVWKHGGRERGRSELKVGARAARWRTWARKRIPEPGRWVVEIVDESGLTLASRNFEVR